MAGCAKLTLYVDCVSPYSYFAYLNLRRHRDILHQHSVKTDVVPFFLGGARDGNGSPYQEPPPVKGVWMDKDLQHIASLLGVNITKPDVFPISSLYPVRVVTYIKEHLSPDMTELSLLRLWEAYWGKGLDISSRLVVENALRPIFPETAQLEAVLISAVAEDNKARTRGITDQLMKGGCFGAPWFIATNPNGDIEQFWGNDRWEHIFQYLGIPFVTTTPLPSGLTELFGKVVGKL